MAYIFLAFDTKKVLQMNLGYLRYKREISMAEVNGTLLEKVGVLKKSGELCSDDTGEGAEMLLELTSPDIKEAERRHMEPVILVDDARNIFYVRNRDEKGKDFLDDVIYKVFGDGYEAGLGFLKKNMVGKQE